MFLTKTQINVPSDCGVILKPFEDSWTFTPNGGNWFVIPLHSVTFYSDGYFLLSCETDEWYETTSPITITGKALIILVSFSNIGYTALPFNKEITFDRDDLYISKYGLLLQTGISIPSKNAAISSFFNIFMPYDEINKYKTRFILTSDFRWEILKDSSGIKSGQFIL